MAVGKDYWSIRRWQCHAIALALLLLVAHISCASAHNKQDDDAVVHSDEVGGGGLHDADDAVLLSDEVGGGGFKLELFHLFNFIL